MFSMNELFFTLSLKKWKIFTEKHIPVSEWVFEIAKSNSAALGFNSLQDIPAVPSEQCFESADFDTTPTYSLCTQTADPNPFRGTYCSMIKMICNSINKPALRENVRNV